MGASSRQESQRYRALVLAGRRSADDPLARAAGAPHRALLDVAGTPMLERVIETLIASSRVGAITLSIDAPELLSDVPGLAKRIAEGELRVLKSADSPSRSVLAALRETSSESSDPLLVTTADHALLSDEMIVHFLRAADRSDADLAVGLVSATHLRARFPEAQRTYLHFRGESYSGANLFALRSEAASRAVEFWTRAEQFRKQPWRLVSTFGPLTLLLFLLRRLDLDAALRRASRVVGVRIRAIELPFAEAAIDVDKLSDLELVNQILSGDTG
jgi:GTP:adenosylcobinamide-phosphate guanylyltransferase